MAEEQMVMPYLREHKSASVWQGNRIVALAVGDEARADQMLRFANAAPDLLEAMKAAQSGLANILDNHPDVWPPHGIKGTLSNERQGWREKIEQYRDAARAAIAKATK